MLSGDQTKEETGSQSLGQRKWQRQLPLTQCLFPYSVSLAPSLVIESLIFAKSMAAKTNNHSQQPGVGLGLLIPLGTIDKTRT